MENIDNVLKKILVNIGYEPKKTLTENKKIILETYAYADKNSKTITLQGNINCEQTGGGANAMELQLSKGFVFTKIGNQLVTSNQTVNLIHDYLGYTVETWKGVTIRISCSTKEVKVDGHGNTFVGENWTPQFNGIVSEACS